MRGLRPADVVVKHEQLSNDTVSVGVQADECDLDLLQSMATANDCNDASLPNHVVVENMHNNLHMSGVQIDCCPQSHIPAPSERFDALPQYDLLETVSAEEASAFMARTGDSCQTCVFPIHDHNGRFDGNLSPGTISYLPKIEQDFSINALIELADDGDRLLEVCDQWKEPRAKYKSTTFAHWLQYGKT